MTSKHPTSSVFVFRRTPPGWRLGLIRHPRFGRMMIPGGHVEPEESQSEAALREVAEETGLDAAKYDLAEWNLQNVYEIYPVWRHRYAPGVTHNTEHVFGLRVPHPLPVRVAPREHLAAEWVPWRAAADRVFSWSNRKAILTLPERSA